MRTARRFWFKMDRSHYSSQSSKKHKQPALDDPLPTLGRSRREVRNHNRNRRSDPGRVLLNPPWKPKRCRRSFLTLPPHSILWPPMSFDCMECGGKRQRHTALDRQMCQTVFRAPFASSGISGNRIRMSEITQISQIGSFIKKVSKSLSQSLQNLTLSE